MITTDEGCRKKKYMNRLLFKAIKRMKIFDKIRFWKLERKRLRSYQTCGQLTLHNAKLSGVSKFLSRGDSQRVIFRQGNHMSGAGSTSRYPWVVNQKQKLTKIYQKYSNLWQLNTRFKLYFEQSPRSCIYSDPFHLDPINFCLNNSFHRA